jgi:hypothetical protein
MYIVEFTRGPDNEDLIERIGMDLNTSSEAIGRAGAMVLEGCVAADGYRILSADGRFLAAVRIPLDRPMETACPEPPSRHARRRSWHASRRR